jgi:hypothetical protein
MHTTFVRKRRHCVAQLLALAALYVMQLAATAAVHAATACLAYNANLGAAIIAVKDSTEPTVLNLEAGTYQLGAENVTFKSPITFVGGFKPGTLCAQHEDNASKTIIDFGSMQNNVEFDQPRGSPNGSISFTDLTLRNGNTLALWSGAEATPPYLGQHDHAGTIVLSHVRITNFHRVELGTYYGHVNVSDTLFDHLYPGGTCAITLSPFDDVETVFNHATFDLINSRDLCLNYSTNDSATWNYTFANSIIWASDGSLSGVNGLNDPYYPYGDQNHVTFDHTLFKGYIGAGATTIHNQIIADPQWVDPAAGDYHLKYPPQALSPAINAGAQVDNVPEPFTDIEGAVRKIGSKADLGAYESPYSDASFFTVTNTSDCSVAGCGSLRDALNLAHNSGAPSATIEFAIPNAGCPAVINLASVLPDVDKPITIDGYSQPQSTINTDQLAFNANLCVVVQPAAGSGVFYGFRVPPAGNGSLTLRGIGIGAFAVGIELFGGGNHQIVGNQFGGYLDDHSYYLGSQVIAGIYMDVPNGQISIGGYDDASRNEFFGQTSGGLPASAVEIGPDVNGAPGSCQILGNTVGVEADGTFSGRNTDYGIYALGSNCFIYRNRVAGVNYDAIWLDGAQGGHDNVVQNNVLGLAAYGIDLSSSNGGAGVRVSGVHNVIGASTTNGGTAEYANLIRYMDAGGVVVTGMNAYGNTIRGNAIQDNGPGGDGMSIDLGGDGPTVNDICDCDVGPNDKQNFPTLHGIAWATPPKANATDLDAVVSGTLRTFPGYYYQVDVYYSEGCDAAGKGIASKWIGSNEFVGLPAQTYLVGYSVQVTVPGYYVGKGALSATATNNINGEGSTSEVGTCLPVDTIFRDGNEGSIGFD